MHNKKEKKSTGKTNQYLKYSGLAFQFFITLGITAFIGQKLDEYFETPQPFITILLVLLVFIALMYKLIKELS